jgi:hypothetical protein
MYEKAVFKIIAMIVLIAFTVSCSSPVNDEGDQADTTLRVPIGKGTPRFVYVDADYDPAETDSGRTLLSIEDNEVAEGVAVIAEIPGNDLNNGSIVRVVNNNNQSVVSFFFRKNQIFPHQVVTQSEKGTVTGTFSLYNPTDQQYSVLFEKEGETEKCELKNLNLNKGIFQVYEDDEDLNTSQNLRLKNAVTALAVWDSIALQIPEDDFTVIWKLCRQFVESRFLGESCCEICVSSPSRNCRCRCGNCVRSDCDYHNRNGAGDRGC